MGEVKRKRPWEQEQNEIENSTFETFLRQLVLCTFILMGLLIVLNSKSNINLRERITIELTKNIQFKDAESLIDYVKSTVDDYLN